MSREPSPFSSIRFEYEREHIYFLDPEVIAAVLGDDPTPVYLVGPRGTGKTTILMSLEWRERLTNESLKKQLPGSVFSSGRGKMLGVYLKLPEFQLQVIERWVSSQSLEVEYKAIVVSTYLDLIWLQQMAEALSALISGQHLNPPIEEERRVVSSICEQHSSVRTPSGRLSTVSQLAASFGRLRERIEGAALANAMVSDFAKEVGCFTGGIGNLGRSVAAMLLQLCSGAGQGEDEWHVRVCMDEGESLSRFQLLVLNSMVRLTKWPVFFVVAFVRQPDDVSETLIPKLSLQTADRKVVSLGDLLTDQRFLRLAEGVTSARIERETASASRFSVESVFGSYGVNELLTSLLSESVSALARDLLEGAKLLSTSPFWTEQSEEDPLPIYQAYLIRRLGIELPSPDTATWRRRRQSSAEIRQRLVAAYLSICADLSVRPRYAGFEIVLALSDSSIRDFLRFVDWTYRSSKQTLSEFIGGSVPILIQDRALKEASEAKLDSIHSSGVGSISDTEKLVHALGVITAKLQSGSALLSHLKSSERGIFSLRLGDGMDEAIRIILEAGEAGYLQLKSIGPDEIDFRMHTSLAPAFGFSYRGAYYKSPLKWEDLEAIRRAESAKEAADRAVAIANRLAGIPEPSLFD
jgi:hypothetical protein